MRMHLIGHAISGASNSFGWLWDVEKLEFDNLDDPGEHENQIEDAVCLKQLMR